MQIKNTLTAASDRVFTDSMTCLLIVYQMFISHKYYNVNSSLKPITLLIVTTLGAWIFYKLEDVCSEF